MCTLVSKYNVAGPRYTSYPTVPYWDATTFSLKEWKTTLVSSFKKSNRAQGISLYIHLPYCERMCTFCGCNKRITKNHDVELPYMNAVLKELDMYVALFKERPYIKQLHLGGGTPTFFSPANLQYLMDGIHNRVHVMDTVDYSFEGHPNNTTVVHLETLAKEGFTRVCYGVQDYNLKVQTAINRIQPFEHVQTATQNARAAGYTSVGHDVIYGLPFQLLTDVINTIEKTIELGPDRIAFYSYAHVPWIKGNGQRGFADDDLPSPQLKKQQYETGKRLLEAAGYVEIGMDHFALPTDDLYVAQENKTIHRNFMGYSASKTQVMVGLGVSSISDSWYSFAQNVKNVDEYQSLVNASIFPVFRGHVLTNEDLIIRKHILNLMCHFETTWEANSGFFPEIIDVLVQLQEMQNDGLVILENGKITVTTTGRGYVRNVCLPFDLRLQRKQPDTQLFSMTI